MKYALLRYDDQTRGWLAWLVPADELPGYIASGLASGQIKRVRDESAIEYSNSLADPLWQHELRPLHGDVVILRLPAVPMRPVIRTRMVEDVVGWEIAE